MLESFLTYVNRQQALDPVADWLQKTVGSAFDALGPNSRNVKNFLHGTWMGHPLHPALTDVPIGAWSAAMGLDLLEWTTGSNELAAGADAAVGIGIMGAIGAAAAGLTDYHDVGGEQARRVGAMHALLNTGALVLFSFSLLYRLRGARSIGRTLGFLGGATTLLSGHLGGELVFGQQIGVDHTATIEPPDDFTKVLAADALKEGEPQRAEANGVPIVLVRQHDHVYALAETCSHQGGPLSEGTVEEGCIICPWHGSRYAVDDGSLLDGPSTYSQPAFETRIREGQIEVRPMRERAPESVLRLAA